MNIALIFFLKLQYKSFDWIRILVQVFDHSPIVMHSSRYLHILLLRRYQIELNTTNQIISFIKQKYTNIAEGFLFSTPACWSPVRVAWKVTLYSCTSFPSLSPLFLISLTNQKLETRNKNHSTMLLKTILSIGKWGILFNYK